MSENPYLSKAYLEKAKRRSWADEAISKAAKQMWENRIAEFKRLGIYDKWIVEVKELFEENKNFINVQILYKPITKTEKPITKTEKRITKYSNNGKNILSSVIMRLNKTIEDLDILELCVDQWFLNECDEIRIQKAKRYVYKAYVYLEKVVEGQIL